MTRQFFLAALLLLILFTFQTPPELSLPKESNLSLASFDVSIPDLLGRVGGKEEPKIELTLDARSAYILDISENKVLFEKNSSDPLPLASIAKLMTAVLLDEKVLDGTLLPALGDRFKKEDLIGLMLAASSNEAAFEAAEFASEGEVESFVGEMNERARTLGLSSMSFLNPHGLDIKTASGKIPGAVGNALDALRLLTYVYEDYPELLERTRLSQFEIISGAGKIITVINTNEAIGDIPNLIGSKTGSTALAGGNLVFLFNAEGHNVAVSILGSSDEGRFEDARKIVQAVVQYYQNI